MRRVKQYESAGVDYDVLDAAKRAALRSATQTTATHLAALGGRPLTESRGEPAFVFEARGGTFAAVLECLGTKSVLARRYAEEGGGDRFFDVGVDAVSAIVNDLVCVGALPLVVHAYFATGDVSWYADEARHRSLVDGWRAGCEAAGAIWGGGESPTLPGLVNGADIELAGSAVGLVAGGTPILGADLAPGDEIVLVESSGLHTNGASLVRAVADGLPQGLRTPIADGTEIGAAALEASCIYVPLIAEVLRPERGLGVTYLSHITGHGLRKLMRAAKALTYRVRALPEVPPVLAALASHAGMDAHSAYGTLNMGVGFAIFCRAGDGAGVVAAATDMGFPAAVSGVVEEGPRRVLLEPVEVSFTGEELELR